MTAIAISDSFGLSGVLRLLEEEHPMQLLLQRVRQATVAVDGDVRGAVGPGLLVLAGFGRDDGPGLPDTDVWRTMLRKTLELRIFPDAEGKMNLSLEDAGGGLLAVSQFTLYADCRKGRRPSFTGAAPPDVARALYDRLLEDWSVMLPGRVAGGVFGADMDVSLTNWGPVTIMLDSATFGG